MYREKREKTHYFNLALALKYYYFSNPIFSLAKYYFVEAENMIESYMPQSMSSPTGTGTCWVTWWAPRDPEINLYCAPAFPAPIHKQSKVSWETCLLVTSEAGQPNSVQ